MMGKLLSLLILGLSIQTTVNASVEEEGIDFDLDAHLDLPDSAVDLAKRVYGGVSPRQMYPFIASISADLPWEDVLEKLDVLKQEGTIGDETINRIEQTYGNYSHPYCAGAVLSSNWIVTSASCITEIKNQVKDGNNNGIGLNYIRIYANRKHLRPTKREAWIDFKLSDPANLDNSVFINKFYTYPEDDNNIALLNVVPYSCRTKNGVETCTKIKKLHSQRYTFPSIARGDPNSSWTYIADEQNNLNILETGGWGLTGSEMTEYRKFDDAFYLVRNAPSFKIVKTRAYNRDECEQVLGFPLNTSTVCTRYGPGAEIASNIPGTSLCRWDFGAPLFRQGIWVNTKASYNAKLLAIFSNFYPDQTVGTQPDNACEGAVMVYTYLPAYCDWLREVTNQAIACTVPEVNL